MDEFLSKHDYGPFIGGDFRPVHKGHVHDIVSPVTKTKWKSLHFVGKNEVQAGINAANEALPEWRSTNPVHRARILRRVAHLLEHNKQALAELMTMEMGKVIKESLAEVDYAVGYFHWFAGEAERLYGRMIPSQFDHKRLFVFSEPVGVCAMITPWNFPLAIPARKVAAAWAAGCTVVAKPSPETPLILLALAHLARKAELPAGVFNVVAGNEEMIGEHLLSSPLVKKLTFTGSIEVGTQLYVESAKTLKKVTLELGGHAPLIVFDDADVGLAVEQTMAAKFRNNGQTCISPNRIFVQSAIAEAYIRKLVEKVQHLRIGDPLLPGTEISEVLHPSSKEKLKRHVDDALSKGGELIYGSASDIHPKVLTGMTSKMKLFQEETFGPLVPIATFDGEEEGIRLANEGNYGLAAYAFTSSLDRAVKLGEQLQYGIIGINDGAPSSPQVPFGGMRGSGFGKEGGYLGIEEYLVEKYVSLGLQLS